MEVANAVGSLRFRRPVVVGFLLLDDDDAVDHAASDSESCSEGSSEFSSAEEARSTAGNSSLD